jgi:hypothetical protein
MSTLKEFQPRGATHIDRLANLANAWNNSVKQGLNLTPEQLEDYMNGLLVTKGIRKAYLIQNYTNKHNFERILNLQKIFPNLKSFTLNKNTFISCKIITEADIIDNDHIADLLGYKSSCSFNDIDRTKTTYSFSIDATTNKQSTINILCFVVPDMTTKQYAEELTNRIRNTIMMDHKLGEIVMDINLTICTHNSIESLQDKIVDSSYQLTESDIEQIKGDLIFNIANQDSVEQISQCIEYENPIHRGILLSFIATYKYTTLEPLFPIQTSEHYQEILDITQKHFTYIAELFKKTAMKQAVPAGCTREHFQKLDNSLGFT